MSNTIIMIKKYMPIFAVLASVLFASTLVASDLSDLEGADRVLVYYFNVEGSSIERIFTADDELSKTVASVKVLNSIQRYDLIQVLKSGGPEHMPYLCFNPRHAFVFEYDAADWKTIEVCFECLTSNISNEIGIENINYYKLGEFVQNLGLVLGPELGLQALKTKFEASVEHRRMLDEKYPKRDNESNQ